MMRHSSTAPLVHLFKDMRVSVRVCVCVCVCVCAHASLGECAVYMKVVSLQAPIREERPPH